MCLSIDWLTIHCEGTLEFRSTLYNIVQELKGVLLVSNYRFRIELLSYSSRQFAKLYDMYLFEGTYNADGSEEYFPFAQIQAEPQGIINDNTILIKLNNRYLYHPHGLEMFRDVVRGWGLSVKRLSRLDICADFNDLQVGDPAQFIADYSKGVYRHIGRSVGTMNFTQRGGEPIIYNALSFGKHDSDTRVYLYNKSLELRVVKDKPYIRDKWRAAGLDTSRDIWRLEISISGKAFEYKDRESGQLQKITFESLFNWGNVTHHYITFVESLFSFIHNRPGITNVSREPRIQLLPEVSKVKRWAIRNEVKGSAIGDKIAIKRLFLAGKLYHGQRVADKNDMLSTAIEIARSRDLQDWFRQRAKEWEDEFRPK